MSAQLNRLRKRMDAIPKSVRAAVRPALERSADELVGTMKRLAPEDDGTLRDSIRKEAGANELSVNVTAGGPTTTRPVRDGADASYDYSLGQEFGTADMPANPFFFPAVRLLRKKIRSRVKRAIAKAVREEFK